MKTKLLLLLLLANFSVYAQTNLVPENTNTTSFDVTLEASKEYFWKIVVRDNKGGETVGQLWKFKTN